MLHPSVQKILDRNKEIGCFGQIWRLIIFIIAIVVIIFIIGRINAQF